MADSESFLARWARRKRDAAPPERRQPRQERAAEGAPAPSATPVASDVEPPFDPAFLPSLDSIGPGSDLRPFLAAGVPAEVRQAALRRAWSTDPIVRDFVGLSESAWDFNAVGAAAGFGTIAEEAVRQLAGKLMGGGGADAPAAPLAEARRDQATRRDGRSDSMAPLDDTVGSGWVAVQDQPSGERGGNHAVESDAVNAATPAKRPREGRGRAPLRPRHGGALPQ